MLHSVRLITPIDSKEWLLRRARTTAEAAFVVRSGLEVCLASSVVSYRGVCANWN